MKSQRELAETLADMQRDSGHDVTTLDLLDDLASCGLALVETSDSEALEAYVAAITGAPDPG